MKELKGRLLVAWAALLGHPIIYKVEISYGEVSIKELPLVMGRLAKIHNSQVYLPRAGTVLVRKGGKWDSTNEANAITEVVRK